MIHKLPIIDLVKEVNLNMKSLTVKTFLKAQTIFFMIRQYGLRDSRQGGDILFCSDVSAITLLNAKEPSLTSLIILKSAQNTLLCFTKIDGKWNCFLMDQATSAHQVFLGCYRKCSQNPDFLGNYNLLPCCYC